MTLAMGVRQAAAEAGVSPSRFGDTGGRRAAVGLKASPGPLYGVSRDVWQALALGVAYADGAR
jgi:hypothetical protein